MVMDAGRIKNRLTNVFSTYTLTPMTNDILKLHGKFQTLMDLANRLDQEPKRFGTDQNMTHTEIHLVEMIGNHEGASVTEISTLIGVTKGAVSQNLKRLEKKGLVVKKTDPDNLSRNLIELTSKGKTAFWAHRDWHETMDGGFMNYLQNLEPEESRIILEFVCRVEDFLTRRLASLE